MLDPEPDNTTTNDSTTPASASAAPPKRRRAASRPAGPPNPVPVETVPTEAAAPAETAAPVATTAPAETAAETAPDAPAPAKKAAAKRTPRKSAAKKAAAAAETPEAAPASETVPTEATATETTATEATASKAPARTPRKRTSKKAAAAAQTDVVPAPEPSPERQPTPEPETVSPVPQAETEPVEPAAEEELVEEPADAVQAALDAALAAAAPAAPLVTNPFAIPTRPADPEPEPTTETTVADEAPVEPSTEAVTDDETDDDSDDSDDAEDSGDGGQRRRRRRRGGRRRRRPGGEDSDQSGEASDDENDDAPDDQPSVQAEVPVTEADDVSTEESHDQSEASSTDDESDDPDKSGGDSGDGRRRRRRRRRRGEEGGGSAGADDGAEVVERVREPRSRKKSTTGNDQITGIEGSTRMEAKRQRRREGRDAGRRRVPILSEAEFLARREAVNRTMVLRQQDDLSQIAVLEDGVLVEHYVDRDSAASLIGNVYLGRVQNVLPSMEAAFIDIGRGRNAVLYAGEVAWESFDVNKNERRVEKVMKSGQPVMVQVSKDPVGAKGARLMNHVTIPGRYIVYSPDGHLSGISRKLPENERKRLRDILGGLVEEPASVVVRTAAEGASEEELVRDVNRLKAQWADIEAKVKGGQAPQLLYSEPDLTVRIVRDLFTEDFAELIVQGNGAENDAWDAISGYVEHVAPHLQDRLVKWVPEEQGDLFAHHRLDEQIAKGLERKVFLPSGGSLVIDRTEAMTVIDVNTGKFTGSGGNLETTITSNNLEAAEEIVRQLRLRDIGGIIVIDFIDMVLPANRELLLRRLVECLGRDRTRHQVAEVTSLGLVQMTRKKIGTGLLEAFSEPCPHCQGRGVELHDMPVESQKQADGGAREGGRGDHRGGDNRGDNSRNDSNRGGDSRGDRNERGRGKGRGGRRRDNGGESQDHDHDQNGKSEGAVLPPRPEYKGPRPTLPSSSTDESSADPEVVAALEATVSELVDAPVEEAPVEPTDTESQVESLPAPEVEVEVEQTAPVVGERADEPVDAAPAAALAPTEPADHSSEPDTTDEAREPEDANA